MPSNPIITQPTERDIAILKDLYRYRVLTTQHLRKKYFPHSSYVKNKIYAMKKSNWIIPFPLVGKNGRKQTTCYRLTDTALAILRDQGELINKKAAKLRVRDNMLPYVLATNDVMIELFPYGWELYESRETKANYNLNRNDLIHGELVSPTGKRYALYILMERTKDENMRRIIREIKSDKFPNYIVLAKGEESRNHFVERATEANNMMSITGELSVMDFNYGIKYLQSGFSDKTIFERIIQSPETPFEVVPFSGDRSPFQYKVMHKGEEKYLVNLMNADIMKIRAINHYAEDINRAERFQEKHYRVLVLVIPEMKTTIKQLMQGNPLVSYMDVGDKMIQNESWMRKKVPIVQ
ncbi:replication-relaxation family protein [Lentibacillus salinarum]|uniref:Replication-relaxation family protein n=1 Tax=Lentibacillus salinarum TaxID=446820 RepID=A0ABW3ZWE0_9BACI